MFQICTPSVAPLLVTTHWVVPSYAMLRPSSSPSRALKCRPDGPLTWRLEEHSTKNRGGSEPNTSIHFDHPSSVPQWGLIYGHLYNLSWHVSVPQVSRVLCTRSLDTSTTSTPHVSPRRGHPIPSGLHLGSLQNQGRPRTSASSGRKTRRWLVGGGQKPWLLSGQGIEAVLLMSNQEA